MLDIPMFWLGPLGQLMPLACPAQDVTNSLELVTAANTSLNGHTTVDLRGVHREWELGQAWLETNEVGFLEAMYSGAIPPPFRIIDPLMKNRARLTVAATRKTSMWPGGNDSWYVTPGKGLTTNVIDTTAPKTSFTTPGDLRVISYNPSQCVLWNPSGTGTIDMYPNGPLNSDGVTIRDSYVDPVLPGEQVTYSFAVKLSATATLTLKLGRVLADGTFNLTSGATYTTAAWGTISTTYTAPSDGTVVGVFPYFTISSTSVDVTLSQGQFETGPTRTAFEPGYGAPETYISQMTRTAPRFPVTNAGLTITEL